MKAVILERKGEDAAVLAENGTFLKVRHAGKVGEEIDIAANVTPMPRLKQRWIRGLAAAALVLVMAGVGYHYTAVSVSAYVSVDAGGSSVEFTVNRLGRVTSVVSVSDSDGELARSLNGSVNGMSVEDAVTSALDTLTEKGTLSPQDDIVIVGITSGSDSQAESLENAIMNNTGHSVHTVRVSNEEREEAHRQELGGGLYVYGLEDAVTMSSEAESGETVFSQIVEVTASVTTTTLTQSVSVSTSAIETEEPVVVTEASEADTTLPVTETTEEDNPAETVHPENDQDGQEEVKESSDDSTGISLQNEQTYAVSAQDWDNEENDITSDSTRPPVQSEYISDGSPQDQHNAETHIPDITNDSNRPPVQSEYISGGSPQDQHNDEAHIPDMTNDSTRPPVQSEYISGGSPQDQHDNEPGTSDMTDPRQQGERSDRIFDGENPPDQSAGQNGQDGFPAIQGESGAVQPSDKINPQDETEPGSGDNIGAPQAQGDAMPVPGTQPFVSYAEEHTEAPNMMAPPVMPAEGNEFSGKPI